MPIGRYLYGPYGLRTATLEKVTRLLFQQATTLTDANGHSKAIDLSLDSLSELQCARQPSCAEKRRHSNLVGSGRLGEEIKPKWSVVAVG